MLVTASGKKKLDNLLDVLKQVKAKYKIRGISTNETSTYSQQMVEKAISIIEILTTDSPFVPDLVYLALKKDDLLEAIAFLDNKQSTNIPVIFNAESQELAQFILLYMENWSLKDDFTDTVLSALTSFDINNIFETMKFNLDCKTKMYDIFIENVIKTRLMNIINRKIFDKSKKIDAATTIDDDFIASMENFLKEMIAEANTLPYVRLMNANGFVNQNKPTRLESNEIESAGNRGGIIWNLISLEIQLNEKLSVLGKPVVTIVYDHYLSKYSSEAREKLIVSFNDLCEQFKNEYKSFKTGHHLGMFTKIASSVNPDKVEVMYQLCSFLSGYQNDMLLQPIGIVAFNAFKKMLDGAVENEKICARDKISLGRLSTLTHDFGLKFFALSFFESDETSDVGIKQQLDKYKICLDEWMKKELDSSYQPTSLRVSR